MNSTGGEQAAGLPADLDGKRDFDLRYLQRDPASSHRHYFPFAVSLFAEFEQDAEVLSVCELGCANGAFADYLLGEHPKTDYLGVDIHPELVSAAAKLVPGGEFRVGNAVDTATLPTGPFDVVFMLTLHSHFDDPARWIDSIDHLLGERGRAYVFGLFNRSPVDVVIRMNDVANGTGWLTGWNQFSEATVGRLAAERGFEYRFHEYTPIARVEKDGADSLRSHTVSIDGSSELTFVNGSQMLHRFALLEMKRSC